MRPCTRCGFNLESSDIFCPSCGFQVGNGVASPPSTPPLPPPPPPIEQRPTVRFDEHRSSTVTPQHDVADWVMSDDAQESTAPDLPTDLPVIEVAPHTGDSPLDEEPVTWSVEPTAATFASVPMTTPGSLCPYCLFGVEETFAACPSCAEAYHGECWSRFGGCVHNHCDRWRLGVGRAVQ